MRPHYLLVLSLVACLQDSAKTETADTGLSPDADGDGFRAVLDCDDDDATTYPGAEERCDDLDNDCDGDTDEGASDGVMCYPDDDGDSYGDADADGERSCTCPDGEVEDNSDCNDRARQINPGATEVCGDGLDNDCDTEADNVSTDEDAVAWYLDGDGDGYASEEAASAPVYACAAPDGYVSATSGAWDCDDADPSISPAADELCSGVGVDEDCDGAADDEDPEGTADGSSWYVDADGDGYGVETDPIVTCTQPDGTVSEDSLNTNGEDCDDEDLSSHPLGTEVCDEQDNDCDGDTDEELDDGTPVQSEWHLDADEDGYPDEYTYVLACADTDSDPSTSLRTYILASLAPGWDCDDTDGDINPAATETCDGEDNNCDDRIDGVDLDDLDSFDGLGDADDETVVGTTDYYADEDTDGFAASADPFVACEGYQPDGYYTADEVDLEDLDCDDNDPDTWPGTLETCDGADNDCNDEIDDGDATDGTIYYYDADGDGYGVEFYDDDDGTKSGLIKRCSLPSGYAEEKGDCDDDEPDANPDGTEECGDNIDNDCDGDTDEAGEGSGIFYYDGDDDGYGDPDLTTVSCESPVGYVTTGDDCDDDDGTRYPGRDEDCDGVDNNCDGSAGDGSDQIDEGEPTSGGVTYYYDYDGDTYGDDDATQVRCEDEQDAGYVTRGEDCEPYDSTVHPDATDTCDARDMDCDGDDDEDDCPCNLEQYDGHYYLFCTSEASWSDAYSACTSESNYDFVTVTSSEENLAVVGILTNISDGDDYWWLGAHDVNDSETTANWDWTTQSQLEYSNWGSGEPNNAGDDEDCVGIYKNYAWNDFDCDTTLYYICESTL